MDLLQEISIIFDEKFIEVILNTMIYYKRYIYIKFQEKNIR